MGSEYPITTFVTQSLEEIRFWSRIMKEHAFFLSLGFTADQQELIREARHFIPIFERIEEQASSYNEHTDPEVIRQFNMQVYQSVASIWAYKRKVLGLILSCKIVSNNIPLLVDHTSREAYYFAKRLKELNEGILIPFTRSNN